MVSRMTSPIHLGAEGQWQNGAETRVECVAGVRLPQMKQFGLVRDTETSQLSIYGLGDPALVGFKPVPA